MKIESAFNIAITCSLAAILTACVASPEQFKLMSGLQETQAIAPKQISGSILNKCIDKFKKGSGANFPEGMVANYSAGGVVTVVNRFPAELASDPGVAKLAAYKIAINKNWLDANNSYAVCYYKYSNGKLVYIESIPFGPGGGVSSIYFYNIASNIYYDLTGKIVRLGY